MRFSRLRVWVGYYIYFKFTPSVVLCDISNGCSLVQLIIFRLID